MEHRAGGEIRLQDRVISGVAMRYGALAGDRAERFAAGAFAPLPAGVPLLLQHDRSSVILPAESLVLDDSADALRIRGQLDETSAAYQLIRRKALRGLSVGFDPKEERQVRGVRVIRRALLGEISVVDRSAYPSATVEVRDGGRSSRRRYFFL